MTKRELIQEYVSGRIDRRSFVMRLTSLGVSSAAALAYAQSLTPSAAAASVRRDVNGYLVRTAPGEYGPGGIFTNIVELLQFLENVLNDILNFISELLGGLFSTVPSVGVRMLAPIAVGDALPNGNTLTQSDADQLKVIHNQLSAHVDAIRTAFSDFGAKTPAAAKTAVASSGSSGDITSLADALSQLVAIHAAVIPTLTGDGAATANLRTTLLGAALVEAQQSAFVNQLVGKSPFPDTFEKAATGDDIKALQAKLKK